MKQELREKIQALTAELRDIEDAEKAVENAMYAGRCFKYRNSYSCPREESDYWWRYRRLSLADDSSLHSLEFQIDSQGEISIEPRQYAHLSSGWIEISEKDYLAAWQLLLMKIQDIEP